MKKGGLIAVVWTLIVLAAGYDSYFAWSERSGLEHWEMNPVARWLTQSFGLQAVLAFKAAGIALGIVLACYCHRHARQLCMRMTAIVGSAYLILSAYYLSCHVGGFTEQERLSGRLAQGPIKVPAALYQQSTPRPTKPTRLAQLHD